MMPKLVPPLNAKQIEKWRPHPARTLELVDGAVPGLRVRLTPSGTMTWSLSARIHGERRRLNLGVGLGLAEARRKAETARRQIGDGIDPAVEKIGLRERRRDAAKGVGTLGAVINDYFAAGPGKDLRSAASARAIIEVVFAGLLAWPSLDVRLAQLQLAADQWRSRATAARAVAFFRPLAAWARKRERISAGFDALEMPAVAKGEKEIGQHVLARDEASNLLRALGWYGHDAAARFMLLTAARREEVVGARWCEIDFKAKIWTVPASRRKDTRAPARRRRRPTADHIVPLSEQALALLARLEMREAGELVFVGARGAKLANWPRWSSNIKNRTGVEVATPHALRRTAATFAGDLGCAPHVISAMLGHRSIGGVLLSGYNKSRFTTEVSEALQSLGVLIGSLELQ